MAGFRAGKRGEKIELPPVKTPYDRYLNSVLKLMHGLHLPQAKLFEATEDFCLYVHEGAGCPRNTVLQHALD